MRGSQLWTITPLMITHLSHTWPLLARFCPNPKPVVPLIKPPSLLPVLKPSSPFSINPFSSATTSNNGIDHGIDRKHWLILLDPPIDVISPKVDAEEFVNHCATMIVDAIGGDVSEAIERIYSISYLRYYSFGAVLSEEMAERMKKMPNVLAVEADRFVSLRYKVYTGVPIKNGVEDMMARQLVEQEMRSGHRVYSGLDMTVNADCKLSFMEFKENMKYKFIIFKIDEHRKQVIVEKLGDISLGHEDLISFFPTDECRYAVYNFEQLTKGNVPKSRIFFIGWLPDTARVRSKMVYANFKDMFKRELGGSQVELRATVLSDMSLDAFKSRPY